jgi:hypothetical protein
MKTPLNVAVFFGMSVLFLAPLGAQFGQVDPLAPSFDETGQLVIDVAGIESRDLLGSPINATLSMGLHGLQPDMHPGMPVTITGIAWDVVVSSFGISYLDELGVSFTSSLGSGGFSVFPGSGDSFSGTEVAYSFASMTLADLSESDVVVLPGGQLIVEFFESFDDAGGAADGIWVSGTITLDYTYTVIPEAGQSGLLAALAATLSCVLRRRRS